MFINKHINNSLVIILMIVAITLGGCHTKYQYKVRKTSPHQEVYHCIETKIGEVSHVFMLFYLLATLIVSVSQTSFS